QAPRLAVRYAGREGGVERVDVYRHIGRAPEARPFPRDPGTHVDHRDAVALGLRPLYGVHGPDPHLHQAIRETLLHDPRERAGVRIGVACELGIEIGVRVEVQHLESRVKPADRADDGVRDRVITAQHDRPAAAVEQGAQRLLDLAAYLGTRAAEGHVAHVREGAVTADVDAR